MHNLQQLPPFSKLGCHPQYLKFVIDQLNTEYGTLKSKGKTPQEAYDLLVARYESKVLKGKKIRLQTEKDEPYENHSPTLGIINDPRKSKTIVTTTDDEVTPRKNLGLTKAVTFYNMTLPIVFSESSCPCTPSSAGDTLQDLPPRLQDS